MSQDNSNAKLWGGRFQATTDQLVEAFSASVQYDKRLYLHDILGSIAHATMLAKVQVLTDDERDAITDGLHAIRAEIEAGDFHWDPALEDVHMNIEAALTQAYRRSRQETAHGSLKKRSGRNRRAPVFT